MNHLLHFPLNKSSNLPRVLSFAFSLKDSATKDGASARVVRIPTGLDVYIWDLPEDALNSQIARFEQSALEGHIDWQIVRRQPNSLPTDALQNELFQEKLTKRLVETLPVGARIISNMAPMSTAKLNVGSDRKEIWKQAKALGIANRTVWVLSSEDDVKAISSSRK